MIELFEYPPTRSQRAKWALEELELDYSSCLVKLHEGEQNGEDYKALHPLGVVPVLRTSAFTIFESVAIVMQLADQNPDQGLAPPVGSADRALYYQWCVFAAAEVDPAIMLVFDNTMRPLEAMRPPGTPHDPTLAQRGRDDFAIRAQALTDVLSAQDFLLESGFSAADIVIGHSCFMATVTGLITDYPILQDYYQRLSQRPGHQRAYGKPSGP